MKYDVIVIGGGPSGLMAAVAASSQRAKTLLLDKGDKLGRKLAISGGGRCNVTNAADLKEIIKHIPGNGRFLYSAFSEFSNQDIIRFFEELGIRLKEEDRGRMFPVSDKAKTVVDALIGKVRELGTDIRVNSPVDRILYHEGKTAGVRLRSGESIAAPCVIVAVGGKSVPHTGSTGDGYAWAIEAGHTVTDLFPTEVPITSAETFIAKRELQGLSLRSISLSVWNPKGKKIIEHEGDMIFTHFGLSGPASLRCSQFVVKTMRQFNVSSVLLTVDLFPQQSAEEIRDKIIKLVVNDPKKSAKNALKGFIPERLVGILLEKAEIEPTMAVNQFPKKHWFELALLLKRFPIEADGTLPLEEAFVTGGGVSLKEIAPNTMMSRRVDGLFFCGEILDIHGYTGGYNITAAFSTGFTAGKNAALRSRHAFKAMETFHV